MHRSLPRTHTSTARVGGMGLRPRRYWTRVLEGVLHARPLRARATKNTPAVPQCARTFHGMCTDTREVTSDSHAPTRAARVRARRWQGHVRGARTHGLTKRTERVRTYHGTHGTAAPIGYYTFSHRARRALGGDSPAAGYSEGTRGVLMGPCVERSARGSGTGRAGHSHTRPHEAHEHAMGYCEQY